MSNSFSLIRRLVENPKLVQLVRGFEADQFVRLIRRIGVEDAGDLIALASSHQLPHVFDEVFWKNNAPGEREKFDPDEFALWLEVIYESSAQAARKIITEMDDDLLVLGLAANLLVVDYESLSLRMLNSNRSYEDDLLEKVLDSECCLEWGDLFLLAKNSRAWDTLIALLVEVDVDDHERINRILETVLHISTEYIEDNGGLYAVLTSGEMLETDLAAKREARREERGYVAPEPAAAFLQLARITPLEDLVAAKEEDYLTRSYFKAFLSADKPRAAQEKHGHEPLPSLNREFPDIYKELTEAEIITIDQAKQLPDNSTVRASHGFIMSVLREMAKDGEVKWDQCLSELNYLANILMAAETVDQERMRPVEAAEKTIALCNEGLAMLLPQDRQNDRSAIKGILGRESLVKLFRIGWNLASNRREPLPTASGEEYSQ
ncbi:DUF6178 family protein [Dethiosulfatarculus sandiegensis]|uniref:Uncharacterized protein n=1 Tax=Dethiosulfatarculus sandiegensis TaxID=1429043 RepID=A0A0D2JBK6_9BACT|nr:DUF6178 family protein [Dethiosulfatarculus sandiegensis]KIX15494.1 hypothetical protein X474_04550 [Dethiosulfatarculus sandiegensis]